MTNVTDEDRATAREYINGALATQAALGYDTTVPAVVIERTVKEIATVTAHLRAASEARKARRA